MPTTTQTIDSDTTIKVLDIEQTIDSDAAIQVIDIEQTINVDSAVSVVFTRVITSASTILTPTTKTITADTTILVNAVELKLFKESDLLTEVGTPSNPIDFGSVEAGTTVDHPDNAFVLFNDKGAILDSVDAFDIQISVLELNIVDELVGNSGGGASETFTVAFTPVDQGDPLTVKVNDVEWLSVSSFAGASPTDEIYTFNFSTGVVTFGDGLQGKIPPLGNTIKISYTPDTILRGKEVSEELWIGVQSNGVIATTITANLERVTPPDVNSCQTLRAPILGVTGVFLNSDPNRLGTNFFTSGSFDTQTGVITLGTTLPNTDDVLIDYTYQIEDDNEPAFVQIGRTTKSAILTRIPQNNGKKLNFRVVVPSSASPSNPNTIRFKLRVEFKQ